MVGSASAQEHSKQSDSGKKTSESRQYYQPNAFTARTEHQTPSHIIRSNEVSRIFEKYSDSDASSSHPQTSHSMIQAGNGKQLPATTVKKNVVMNLNERPSFNYSERPSERHAKQVQYRNSHTEQPAPTIQSPLTSGGPHSSLISSEQTNLRDTYTERPSYGSYQQYYNPPHRLSAHQDNKHELSQPTELIHKNASTEHKLPAPRRSNERDASVQRVSRSISPNAHRSASVGRINSEVGAFENQSVGLFWNQSPLRTTQPQSSYGAEYNNEQRLSLATLPDLLENTEIKKRGDKNSAAYKHAMIALQEKNKVLEDEVRHMAVKLEKSKHQRQQEIDELTQRFRVETGILKEKEQEIKEDVYKMHEEIRRLNQELAQSKTKSQTSEEELSRVETALSKAQADHQAALNVSAMLKKEIQTVETEKERHLEHNASEKDKFTRSIRDLEDQLVRTTSENRKLTDELREAFASRTEIERRLDKVIYLTQLH